jgi:signal transduction histidine kinase
VILLSLALVVSILVTRSILLNRVEARIQTRLVDEVQEVHLFAANAPPTVKATYREHVRELFASLLPVDPPGPGEANITFVDGQVYLSSPDDPPYRLDQDPSAAAAWANVEKPTTGTLDTPAGLVDYRAEPVSSGDGSQGVYVVAVFRELAQNDVNQAMAAAVVVAIAALLVGSLLAWTATGRMLRPVSAVTSAARTITETDLTKRIPMEGDEEIAILASTFNDMLDRLEAAFHSQRAFLDDAGHELRTPITVITGQLELLEEDPAQRAATMTLVMGELDRMARIVNDLLLLAKAQQPDLLRLDTVDVAELTEELFAKVGSLGDHAWELDSVGKGVIVADRQRLTEAVIQLAENAVKHAGGGTLRIGSAVGAGFARFWVRDEGRGIPADQQARLFDRFSRGQGQSRTEGSGLGLTIVKAIADAHHGHVDIESAPGRGSTFTVVVPVDQPLPDLVNPPP